MLTELLDDVLELQERHSIPVTSDCRRDISLQRIVHGFPVELRQVFLNLIGNAIQAMPNGGNLRVIVREATDWNCSGAASAISIVDTGVGIKPEDAQKLFRAILQHQVDQGHRPGPVDQQRHRAEIRRPPLFSKHAHPQRIQLRVSASSSPSSGTFNLIGSAAGELTSTGVELGSNGFGSAMQHV